MASKESPDSVKPSQPWEGMHGLRYTGIGVVRRYPTTSETNPWLIQLGLEPMLADETISQWERRTKGGKDAGSAALHGAAESPDGGTDGN